jgi:hypothetical protein
MFHKYRMYVTTPGTVERTTEIYVYVENMTTSTGMTVYPAVVGKSGQ